MEILSFAEAAATLGITVVRFGQLVRDGQLVALPSEAGARIPALFLQDGAPVKHLGAVVTLLRDGGYGDQEIVDWLFRADDTLTGTPIEALRSNRGTEIKRRAQAAAF